MSTEAGVALAAELDAAWAAAQEARERVAVLEREKRINAHKVAAFGSIRFFMQGRGASKTDEQLLDQIAWKVKQATDGAIKTANAIDREEGKEPAEGPRYGPAGFGPVG